MRKTISELTHIRRWEADVRAVFNVDNPIPPSGGYKHLLVDGWSRGVFAMRRKSN
jgi:hypothetical protein